MQDRSVGDITVLAVDDSASIRKLVELTLRREGYSVVTADSGLKALAELARQRPDLLLLDVMLVALDGFQLCRVIRNHPEYGDLPIVILSGRETAADREAGLRAEFVEDPNQAGEWLAREILPGDVVLLKASRGVRLEQALEKWKSRAQAAPTAL